jgi:8-oxo-dGTP diphosphatase
MKGYNIRVYALIEHAGNILVTDELRWGKRMTKFPGGGHEWGEGLEETVRRECREELNQEPVSVNHFYTTDFFIASAFQPNDQLISIYYWVTLPHPELIPIKTKVFDFDAEEEGAQIFRWIPKLALTPEMMTYPIDRKVVEMVLELDFRRDLRL